MYSKAKPGLQCIPSRLDVSQSKHRYKHAWCMQWHEKEITDRDKQALSYSRMPNHAFSFPKKAHHDCICNPPLASQTQLWHSGGTGGPVPAIAAQHCAAAAGLDAACRTALPTLKCKAAPGSLL